MERRVGRWTSLPWSYESELSESAASLYFSLAEFRDCRGGRRTSLTWSAESQLSVSDA